MDSLDFVKPIILALIVRAGYEATRPQEVSVSGNPGTCDRKLTNPTKSDNVKPSLPLPPGVKEWQRKELRRYREAQPKKWRNWTEAMFQPKS